MVASMALAALGLATAGRSPGGLLEEARLSLREALEKALPPASPGSAVAAELRAEKNRIVFTVAVAEGARTSVVAIDAKTGEVVGKAGSYKDYSRALGASRLTLATAVDAALRRVTGQAVEAELQIEGGRAVIEVEVFAGGKVLEVTVDAQTGEVMEIEEDDDES